MAAMAEGEGGLCGAILAGGLSRRMGGGDKCLLEIGGESLLRRAVARLAPQLPQGRAGLVLNANGDPSRFSDYGLPVAADETQDFAGPLAGVLAGLEWAAARGAARIVTVAADTPFFPLDLAARLERAAAQAQAPLAMAASPDETGRLRDHPTFGLWPVALRHDLRAALAGGLRKVVLWTAPHGCARAEFAPAERAGRRFDPFFNVNTPDDMTVAAALASDPAPDQATERDG